MYKKSMALMIPKAPPLPPRIKPSGAPVVFEAVDTPFLPKEIRDNLEFHIKQKKLQHLWGLPLHVQKSIDAFIPPAPKIILSQLHPKPIYDIVVELSDLPFISKQHKKAIKRNIRRKTIQKRWGLPKIVLESLRSIQPPAAPIQDLQTDRAAAKTGLDKEETTLKSTDAKTDSKPEKSNLERLWTKTERMFQMYLFRKCLETRLEMLPAMVDRSYNEAYPVLKVPLIQLIPPHTTVLKPRPGFIPFIEPQAIDRLELNLKHKRIDFLWAAPTLYTKSLQIMIPKAPPLPPLIKPSGAVVAFEAVDTPFLKKELRVDLEFHVKRKKLQHLWGLPLHVQESVDAFIPPAPKIILSQLHPKPIYDIVVELSDLPFISKQHKKAIKRNIRRKTIQKRWGLPKIVLESLRSIQPPAAPIQDLQTDRAAAKTGLDKEETTLKSTDAKTDSKPEKSNLERLWTKTERMFQMYLFRKCLETRLEMLPAMVDRSYNEAYPVLKVPLIQLIPPHTTVLKPRPGFIPFIEPQAIDRLELNLKHKRIDFLWAAPTLYTKSLQIMIPKAPPLPPLIKPSGAVVAFEAVDTPFLKKELRVDLEFHVKRKKLQHLWGLPLHVQESVDAFIPPAPKIILSQLHPKPIYDIVVELSDLPFISKQHKKAIKRNIRRKTIQKRWGLPKIVLESLRSIQPPAAPIQDLQTDRAAAKTGLDKEETTLKSTDAKTDSKPEKSNLERLWTKTERMFQMYLFRKCLETRLEMLPAMVDRSYNEAYPVLKVPLIQLIPPHTTVLKPRPGFIPFIEPQAIDRLELNLKHKRIDFLWAAPTLYTKSLQIMIPKAPPLPPLIKPSGAVVAFEAVDTPFLKKELRVDLEFHVKRKKLQHLWGLPLHVQESVDAFIPPAPKIILSQLHPKPIYDIVVELSDLPFISKQHKKAIKRNIRRKTIQKRWGLPKIVLESLRSIQPPAAPIQDLQTDRAAAKTGLDKEETTLKSTDAKTDSKPEKSNLERLWTKTERMFQMYLFRKCLETRLEMLPAMVDRSYNEAYPVLKVPLIQLIPPHTTVLKPRPGFIPFIEPQAIDRLELNLKHKRIDFLWAAPTLYTKSLQIMIPKAPPLPPLIKPSGAVVAFEAVDTPFLKKELRVDLEFHVKRKKLQHLWGLPLHVQESVDAFIPPAPKIILSQLHPKPIYDIVVELSDLPFISKQHKKAIKRNIRRKTIQKRWGLPKIVLESLRSIQPPAAPIQDLQTDRAAAKTGLDKEETTLKSTDAKTDSKPEKSNLERLWTKTERMFQMYLFRKCLETRLEMLPAMVDRSYNEAYPVLKVPLIQLIPPHTTVLKPRPGFIPFIEPQAIDRLELNLKHKRIDFLWAAPTLYTKSLQIMIPKAPPLPPLIKPSGAVVAFEAVDTPFLKKELRVDLEFHVKRKKLQHLWGLPLHVQESVDAFIPPAPKIILSQLHPKPIYDIVVELSDLPFISKQHKKAIKRNIRRKTIQKRWGLPKIVLESLRSIQPPAAPIQDLQTDRAAAKTGLDKEETTLKSTDAKTDSKPEKSNLERLWTKTERMFQMYLFRKCLETRLEMLPAMVDRSYNEAYPVLKVPLIQLIPPHTTVLKPRPGFIPFIEPQAIDRLELNLKHKRIDFLWAAPTLYTKSLQIMIPKAPPLPPLIKPSGAVVAFEAVDTPFLKKELRVDLEFHVKRKKLQHLWGLPLHVQESVDAFIPPAPKIILSQLHPKPIYDIVVELSDLPFISKQHKKAIKRNIRRKTIQKRWGLPKIVLESLRSIQPPAAPIQDLQTDRAAAKTGLDKEETTLKSTDAKTDSKPEKSNLERLWTKTERMFQMYLFRKCLETRLEMLPAMVDRSYNEAYPVLKVPLIQLIPPHTTVLKPRPGFIPFIEPQAIDRLELNLKHKRIDFLWAAPTLYTKSLQIMIPKAPPLPPLIKPSGAVVAFEAVDTPFLKKELRVDLEFHVKRKKLQHLWGLPLHVQESVDAFIPPAPKIILSQLHPKPIYDIVVELSDLPFISKQHKKAIKRNIRRKTIQKRWGLPKIVLESLRSIQPPAAPIQDLQTDRAAAKTGLDKEETTLKSTDAKTDSKPEKSNLERLWTKTERMFQMYLFRKCLETRLEMLPAMVDRSYNEAYPVLKVPLIQLIPPHTTVLKPRPGFIPFIEPQAIDRLELNLKHKRIDFLWAAPTLYTKSLQIMIPKAPPLPPLIKPSGAVVAFEAVDTPFLKKELRVDLEFHVKRKKLQHLWGLPLHVQESVDAFIPPAPKIILSQLHPKPIYDIVVELSDLPFISKQHKKAIKRNIRRKTIQKRWGLPKIVLESLRSIQPPAAPIQDLQTDRAAAKTGLDKEETTLKSTDAKTDSKPEKSNLERLWTKTERMFQMYLFRKCLETRLEMLPAMVDRSYNEAYPVLKVPLIQLIPPHTTVLKPRPGFIPFIEPQAIDRLELNLKHKRIDFLWAAPTLYTKSLQIMIPKAPPLPPLIKPSGAVVAFEAVDTPFLKKELRVDLEFHVKRKKLQHLWGLPLHVQESVDAFIPPAPKIILSQLHPKPIYDIVVELSDLPFISKQHKKAIKRNIRRKTIQKRWGLPKIVLESLRSIQPPAAPIQDLQTDRAAAKTGLDKEETTLKSTDAKTDSKPEKSNLERLWTKTERMFQMYLFRKCLETRLEMLPAMVDRSYNEAYPVLKVPLIQLIPPHTTVLKPRPGFIPFIEPQAIDRLELNLKHKRIDFLWAAPTLYTKSLQIMIPKAPPLPPLIKPSGAVVAFEAVDTPFLKKELRVDLEFHVKRKKLQHLWGLPLHVQESVDAFIPPAPKIILSQLHPKPIYDIVVELSDLPFISKQHKKAIKRNIRRKTIQKRWGLPKIVLESLRSIQPPAAPIQDLQTDRAAAKTGLDKEETTLKSTDAKTDSKPEKSNLERLWTKTERMFQMYLFRKCLETRLEMLPAMVDRSYNEAYPVLKVPLIQLIPPHTTVLKPRPGFIPFIEPQAIDRLELNLKHKRIDFLWAAPTLYTKSLQIMIPKAPPLPPLIKPSGAVVAFEAVDTPFLKKELRVDLEFHVKRKKLQHLWGLPLHVQESVDAFIPPAPKIILSQLHPKPIYDIVVELSDLPFISKQHKKAIKRNIRRKTIQKRWGLPKIVLESLRSIQPPAAPIQDLQTDRAAAKTGLDKEETTLKSTDAKTDSKPEKSNLERLWTKTERMFQMYLFRKCLETRLEMLPAMVDRSYNEAYPVLKVPLIQLIPPHTTVLKPRPGFIPFIEPQAIDRLELNLKHKRIDFLWAAPTLYTKSLQIMIPKAPPLPPLIKPSGAVVAFEAVDTPFLKKELRVDLEFHVKRKKLQHLWGLPLHVQESVDAFIPPAPKIILSQLHPKPIYDIVVELSDLPFISKQHKKAIKRNIRRKTIQKRWGLPKIVLESLRSIQPPAAPIQDLQTDRAAAKTGLDKEETTLKSTDAKTDSKPEKSNLERLWTKTERMFQMYLFRKCLETRLEMLPAMVDRSYNEAYPVLKVPLIQLIPPHTTVLKPRPGFIPFIEPQAIDRLELNLKHKRIDFLWAAPTLYTKSLQIMIPKAPPLPPLIKPSGAVVAFEAVDTPFLKKELRVDLEFHVKRKKLQHLWGLPLHVQESVDAFIPPAPKIILSQLHPKPIYDIVVELSDLPFISKQHKKAIKRNIRRKTIQKRWGLPKIVLESLRSIQPPAAPIQDLQTDRAAAKTGLDKEETTLKSTDAKTDSKPEKSNLERLWTKTERMFQMYLFRKCLETRLEMLPAMVDRSYNEAYPVLKVPLIQLIPPHTTVLKPRPGFIPFIEPQAIDRLELNLKHKRIDFLWAAPTLYTKSLQIMIPKAPPLPPLIKPSGAVVAFEAVDTPFLKKELRVDLEFHVKRKKLQHLWGLPLHVQESVDAFIPPAPKIILSQLHPKPIYDIVVELSDLPFISKQHKKAIKRNIRRKTIQKRWGLPKIVLESLRSIQPPAAPIQDLQTDRAAAKTGLDKEETTLKSTDAKTDSKPEKSNLERLWTKTERMFQMYLFRKCLETRLEMLPAMVDRSYNEAYPVLKVPLIQLIPPHTTVLKPRPGFIPFIEPQAIDRLELNLKHKRIDFLWAAPTLYTKSLQIMIPKAPPLPPLIKPSGAVVAFEAVDTPFLKKELRVDLEFHVKRKKLQHLWGLPLHVQESVDAFIPPAPKIILSQLHPKPIYDIVVELSDLPFISKQHKKAIKRNIRRKTIQKRWGLPKIVLESLRSIQPPAAPIQDLQTDRAAAKTGLDKEETTLKSTDAKTDSKPEKSNLERLWTKTERMFQMYLFRKCLETRLEMLPAMVDRSYNEAYPVLKVPLIQLIPPHTTVLKPRPGFIPFIEPQAIDRLELNLKHKRIDFLWAAPTLYTKSLQIMIPKAPPLPPLIKPSGAVVAFEAVDTPFLKKELRVDLEFHVKRKKLQHLWGLPLHVQESVDAFIPPAPKIILSQLHPKPIYDIVVELSDLPFISKQHKKAIKRNIRRKTIQKRWGLPKIVLESLRSIQPPAAPIQDLQTDRAAAKTGLDKEETTLKSTDAKTDSKPEKSNLERLWTKTERMFQMYLFRKCLETRLEMLPAMVDRSYNEAYPVLKVPLIQLIPPHTTVLKPRPGFIPFIEPQAIDRLELNLKHKRIDFLWAAPTLYTKSLQIMIPKAPPLPPLIKPSGAVVAFEAVDTPFLKKELRVDLEFHVKRKKLQHLWGLPLHVQESVDAFIPPAPKIILSQLHPKPIYDIVVELSDLPFISKQHKKAIKRNIRRKTIQKRWGLPKIVLESLRSIQPPAAPIQDLQTDRAAAKTGLDKEETTLKSTDAKTDSKPEKSNLERLWTKTERMFQMYLFRKCLETRLEMLPAMVDRSYNEAYPVLKVPLIQLIPPHTTVLKPRPGFIPFIEPQAIDRLELNLKHKRIDFLWAAPTLYTKSLQIMIPKAPPLPPLIKPSGAVVAFEAVDTPFLKKELRVDLEFHVKRKKLQHLWGLPLHVQESVDAFIPPAPKIILSQLHPKPIYDIVVELSDLPFISKQHKKAIKRNIRRKTIQKRWGLPKIVLESLRSIQPPAAPIQDLQTDRAAAKTGLDKEETTLKSTDAKTDSKPEKSNLERLWTKTERMFQMYLFRKCLETRLEMLPAMVDRSYNEAYPVLKVPLIQLIPPHTTVRLVAGTAFKGALL
ncbi:UNVERIFIED_CONTAM: hypothetical protein FKN15_013083 [Acipenser sinensis]